MFDSRLTKSGTSRMGLAILTVLITLLVSPFASAQTIPGLTAPAETESTSEDPAAEQQPLEALLEVLRDDTARQELIEELEAQLQAPAEQPVPTIEDDVNTFGGRIADFTKSMTESAAESVDGFVDQIQQAPALFTALGDADYRVIGELTIDLALLVLVTYGVFFLARYLTENFRNVLKLRSARSGVLAALLATVFLLVSNLIMVVVAWAAGQIMAVTFLSTAGRIAFHHSLFLNAFLLVEVIHAFVRAILSPGRPQLRLVALPNEQAIALTRWARITVSILAFVQLLIVPVFDRYVSISAGEAISVVGYLIVLALLVNLTLRLRQPVGQWLLHLTSDDPGGVLHFIARFWHLPVLVYLIILFAVVVIWPEAVLLGMLAATGKIIIAIIIGAIVGTIISRIIMAGIRLPEGVSSKVPLLEQRLNSFVPRALTVLRILVVIIVAGYVLDAIGVFSVAGWLESELGGRITAAIITVAVILFVAFAIWLTVSSWVDYRLQPAAGHSVTSRERTLLILLRNAITVAIIVFTLMFCLAEIGINIAPLLASAGVIGLAIGFGAQKLVQDIITGIFMQLEGAIDVGDVVEIGGISGSVERLTIRSAGLRDLNGVYHLVPFSSVDTVSNYMRGFAYALCDMGVAYRENVDDVKQAMFDAYDLLMEDPDVAPNLVDRQPEWMGLDRFDDSAVILRLRIKTLPGQQWGVGRAYNAVLKRIFDERDIEIPFPHQTVYFGVDKAGKAPPMHVIEDGEAPGASGKTPPKRKRQRRATPSAQTPGLPDNDRDDDDGDAPR
ncbi:mechanosensitive ion channel domain-containing protein [Devosia pacifica]|nr:mechanosensitive ion channel domain-containing protein [Devosia pacifica]